MGVKYVADGKVVIDIVMEDGSINRTIKDVDENINGLGNSGERASLGIGKIVAALGLVALASKAVDMVKESLDGAISRYDTLNQFPRVMQMMGFDADESEAAISKLSDGIDGLPTKLDSVTSTAQNIAVLTGDLDGAVDTTLALNNAFLSSGASTADAERGLIQYVQMLSRGEVDLQSWRTLQETMGPALNKTAEAFGFTGKSAQTDLYDALKDGEITFDEFNDQLIELSEGVGGFADMAAEGSAGIATSWQNMKTAIIKGVADVIGGIDEALGGTGEIEKIIDKMKTGVQIAFDAIVASIPAIVGAFMSVVEAAKSVYDALEPWLPLITAVIAGIVAFQTTIAIINGVKTAITAIRTSFMLLNATILANPIALVVAAIVAAAVLVYVYWEPISEFFIGLWESIKESGIAIWEAIVEVWDSTIEFLYELWNGVTEFFVELWTDITEVFNSVWESIIEIWDGVVETVEEIFTPIIEFFVELWTGVSDGINDIWDSIVETLEGVWSGLESIAAGAWELIKLAILGPILLLIDLMTGDFEAFGMDLSAIWEKIKEAAGKIWDGLVRVVTSIVSGFIDVVTGYWNTIKSVTSTIFNGIKSTLSSIWTGIKTTITTVVTGIWNTIIRIWNGIVSTISSVMSSIFNTISDVWNSIISTISGILEDMKTAITNAWDTIKEKTTEAFNKVKDFIMDPLEDIDLLSIGKDIIQGLIDGIKAKVQAVADAVTDVADKITGKITKILGIKSPSRVFMEFGENLLEGLSGGIIDKTKLAVNATKNMADDIMDAFDPELNVNDVAGLDDIRNMGASITGNIVPVIGKPRKSEESEQGRGKNRTVVNNVTNHFTPAESTPAESARKQKQELQTSAMRERRSGEEN